MPRFRAVAIEHGGDPARETSAAGEALAELGTRLSGDADLGHGGDSFEDKDQIVGAALPVIPDQ
jgi:hypothetical protein